MAQTDKQTDRQTYGHCDSKTESAQWANSVKICDQIKRKLTFSKRKILYTGDTESLNVCRKNIQIGDFCTILAWGGLYFKLNFVYVLLLLHTFGCGGSTFLLLHIGLAREKNKMKKGLLRNLKKNIFDWSLHPSLLCGT